jgi:hypothetical protein
VLKNARTGCFGGGGGRRRQRLLLLLLLLARYPYEQL